MIPSASALTLLQTRVDLYPQQAYLFIDNLDRESTIPDGPLADADVPVQERVKKLLQFNATHPGQPRQVVAACILTHQHAHPHVLFLTPPSQSSFHLPCGYVAPGETHSAALQRCLYKLLACSVSTTGQSGPFPVKRERPDDEMEEKKVSAATAPAASTSKDPSGALHLEVADLLGSWVRPSHQPLMYPLLPPHVSSPTEEWFVYLVKLPDASLGVTLTVQHGLSVTAVPLFDLHGNDRRSDM